MTMSKDNFLEKFLKDQAKRRKQKRVEFETYHAEAVYRSKKRAHLKK